MTERWTPDNLTDADIAWANSQPVLTDYEAALQHLSLIADGNYVPGARSGSVHASHETAGLLAGSITTIIDKHRPATGRERLCALENGRIVAFQRKPEINALRGELRDYNSPIGRTVLAEIFMPLAGVANNDTMRGWMIGDDSITVATPFTRDGEVLGISQQLAYGRVTAQFAQAFLESLHFEGAFEPPVRPVL